MATIMEVLAEHVCMCVFTHNEAVAGLFETGNGSAFKSTNVSWSILLRLVLNRNGIKVSQSTLINKSEFDLNQFASLFLIFYCNPRSIMLQKQH